MSANPAPSPAAIAQYGGDISQAQHKINMSPTLMFPMVGAGIATNVVTTQMIAEKRAQAVIFFVLNINKPLNLKLIYCILSLLVCSVNRVLKKNNYF